MYKCLSNTSLGPAQCVQRLSDNACIPFDPAKTDYANFKAQIMAVEAELQDAEGVTMSPDAAKQFVATLP